MGAVNITLQQTADLVLTSIHFITIALSVIVILGKCSFFLSFPYQVYGVSSFICCPKTSQNLR